MYVDANNLYGYAMEGGQRRATGSIWSVKVLNIDGRWTKVWFRQRRA